MAQSTGAAHRILSLDQDWKFGGKFDAAALMPDFDDSAFQQITLPHCATPLSWQNWNPADWENIWIYRRDFEMPQNLRGLRTFLDFDRVTAGASPRINGHQLPQHIGGFLPFEYEITDFVKPLNQLTVAVDSRWLNVPPSGSPKGPRSIDYLLPGGISGSVRIRAVPSIFIDDVFAKPTNVLAENRSLEVACRIDARVEHPTSACVQAVLRDGDRVIATASGNLAIEQAVEELTLTLTNLGNVRLWDVDRPSLYTLVVTLFVNEKPLHDYETRVGFRDARFEVDGFFLNGRRFRLFGLDRHELYPYFGFSASPRALRRDAEILRRKFNCNSVRCSHYPQSPAFLDACDELGLLVWEEIPGWQYIGDERWQKLVLRDVEDMIRRDRSRPSIIIWGVRVNESNNDPDLYTRTRELAKSLDDSRPTSGTMTPSSIKNWREEWHQDVFAFDDYHSAPDGSVGINPPLPGVPYLITEAVGQFDYGDKGFNRKYRRAGDLAIQTQQALLHAQAHSRAASFQRCAGVIAWCAFDYASLMNAYNGVKCPGVADVFRVPKLGASFYLAQVDPEVKPMIEPDFYWDFGDQSPFGPGERTVIFSNCDRLELFIDDKLHEVVAPDRASYPNLKSPPFFADLKMDGTRKPELRIDAYLHGKRVLSRAFSSNRSSDQLFLELDDVELRGDGSDSTRLLIGVSDKFGVQRPFAGEDVALHIDGPGVIVGENPFRLEENGGVGAVWIKSLPRRTGQIRIEAQHPILGQRTATIEVR